MKKLKLRLFHKYTTYQETLRKLQSKTDREVLTEMDDDRKKILASPLGEDIYAVPQPLSLPGPLSPKEDEQERTKYKEMVRKGLALFLASSTGQAFARPSSRKDKSLRDTRARVIETMALPRTREWRGLKQKALEAWASLHNTRDQSIDEEIAPHIGQMHRAEGNGREYIRHYPK